MDSKELLMECARLALEKKAENVLALHIGKVSSLTDYFLIASVFSDRQIQAIADSILSELKTRGVRPLHVEGLESYKWVILDYGDVVVHLFHDTTRDYYRLETHWEHAPRVPIPEALYFQHD